MQPPISQNLGAWLLSGGPIVPPPTAAEEDAFRRYCEEFSHAFVTAATILIAVIIAAWWPLDRWVLPPAVSEAYVGLRYALVGFAFVGFGLMRVIPVGPGANVAASCGIVAFGTMVSWHLGEIDGLIGVQYIYVLPFGAVLLAVPWKPRATVAALTLVGSWGAVVTARGELPMIAAGTASSSIAVALISVVFGEGLFRLMRSRYVSEHRLVALRAHLEERVEEQGRDLRSLARDQIDSRDNETRWVSRELHDALGQELTAMRVVVDLAALQLDSGRSAEGRETLAEVEGLIRRQQVSLRRILAKMRPEAVEQLGLIEALRALTVEVTRGTAVTSEFALEDDFVAVENKISPASADALYRILQEALSNVVRHSGAAMAWVTLERDGSQVVLRVADDGHGMTVARDGACHVGLLGIRERAALCGGIAVWGPGPSGRGLGLEVHVPLSP